MRLGSVLDDGYVATTNDLLQWSGRGNLPVQMHGHYRLGPHAETSSDCLKIKKIRGTVYVH